MAQLDLKKCSFRIWDGTMGTRVIGAGNAQVTYTDLVGHRGQRNDLLIAHVVAGSNTALSVVVATAIGVTTITVNAATDGGGLSTTTATAAAAAVNADSVAKLLVKAVAGGTGGTVIVASAAAAISLAQYLDVHVGNGTLDFSEATENQYTLDRGKLDTVKTGEEQPCDVSIDSIFENYTAVSASGTPTPYEAITKRGEASAWKSTSGDACGPYACDIEVMYNPGACSNELKEFYQFEEFYYEEIDLDFKGGTLKFRGKQNRVQPTVYRVQAGA